MVTNKNQTEVDSLVQYLGNNPNLRFWQGLLAWAKEYYKGKKSIEAIIVRGEFVGEDDTFYWENKIGLK